MPQSADQLLGGCRQAPPLFLRAYCGVPETAAHQLVLSLFVFQCNLMTAYTTISSSLSSSVPQSEDQLLTLREAAGRGVWGDWGP